MATLEESLCGHCGLCCDGSLFEDVVLDAGELAPIEARVGYSVDGERFRLHQPCQALAEGRCTVYADRPRGCRAFECGVLQEVRSGGMDLKAAMEEIDRTRMDLQAIETLLEALGNTDRTLPLTDRCQAVLAEPLDLSEPEARQAQRGELYQRVTELESHLSERFRNGSD